MPQRLVLLTLAILLAAGCARRTDPAAVAEAQEFLDQYTAEFQRLYAEASEAQWSLNTHIVDGDSSNKDRVEATEGALAAYTGSVEVIETTRGFLAQADRLEPLQVKQLERILYTAANNPQTVPDLVAQRIEAEAAQTERLFGFEFEMHGKTVSANEIDRLLIESTDPAERRRAWEASKDVGRGLKSGLSNLVRLRNETVQALGYGDYFEYQVSDYGMTVAEMMELCQQFVAEVYPLYRELHTWARYTLAEQYGQPVPDLLPAHWLPNRWGQNWNALVTVEGFDLEGALQQKSAEWLVGQAERFYVSLGFAELPPVFWEKSSLYPLPAETAFKKNNHASAWHMDLENDVRSLMSVEPTSRWYETTHHELGHIYYYIAYTNPDVPPLLREGANRGFHEAIGSLLGMASMQRPFVEGLGLLPADTHSDEIQTLLKEALDFIVFLPFSAGTMTHFEHDLYATNLGVDSYNQRWWEQVRRFQGIAPPAPRGEEFCDAASKTHINDDAAQYYDYAISYILLHQFHAYIAREILDQNPRSTNYFGNQEVGRFLGEVLALGATRDWRQVMQEYLGEQVSARPMLKYFAPLTEYLREQNAGRTATLPPL